jgi:hypothetical protein
MSKTSSPAPSEAGRHHGGIAPLAVVFATNLANAHSTDQSRIAIGLEIGHSYQHQFSTRSGNDGKQPASTGQ